MRELYIHVRTAKSSPVIQHMKSMDATCTSTAQAKAFTSPASISFPWSIQTPHYAAVPFCTQTLVDF